MGHLTKIVYILKSQVSYAKPIWSKYPKTFFIKKNYRDEWGECETSKEEDLDYEEY